jgi:hypothetical protein
VCLPCEAPPLDTPGVVQGGRGCRAHVHVGAMAVALQAARAALPGGRGGGRGTIIGIGQGPSLRQLHG